MKQKKKESIKKEIARKPYVNTHIGKGKNSSENVLLRQEELIRLLGSGLDLKAISKILNVSIDTLYKDKQDISKKGLENLRNLGNAELTFYFSTLISDMNNNKRFLWNIINSDNLENQSGDSKTDNDNIEHITIDHKIKASKNLIEIDKEFREMYKDTVNAIIIPDYTKRLDNIEKRLEQENIIHQDIENKENNKPKSFMNIKRPQLTKDMYKDKEDNDNNNINSIT